MYCSKSTGPQDFRAEPTWSYPSSTSPSLPAQMSLRLSSPAWQHSLHTSPHPKPTFWEPTVQDLQLHTSYLIFQGVPPHLSWRLLPASQLPFCGAGLIERALEESSPARSQKRCYFWFFSSFFSHLRWGTTAIQTDCLRLFEVWKTIFFSVWGRRNGMVSQSCCQNDPWVTAWAPHMRFALQGSGAAEIPDPLSCYSQRKQQGQGEADRLYFCKIVFLLGSFSLVCLWDG